MENMTIWEDNKISDRMSISLPKKNLLKIVCLSPLAPSRSAPGLYGRFVEKVIDKRLTANGSKKETKLKLRRDGDVKKDDIITSTIMLKLRTHKDC